MAQSLEILLEGLPSETKTTAAQVRETRRRFQDRKVFVVIDDDPTGTQSVSGLPVLCAWEKADFEWAFKTGKPAVYVMANTRSLSPREAERVNREIVGAALDSAKESGTELGFVSRSDSTLRGHFPLEPRILAAEVERATGRAVDGIVLVPAFPDAGRLTVGGRHYAGSPAKGYVPVGETEFSRDASFGFRASDLREWVEEKTSGSTPASDVVVLDLATIRARPEEVSLRLRECRARSVVVVDAVTENDLRRFAVELIKVEGEGRLFIYRTGPSFPRARIGQEERAPLTVQEIRAEKTSLAQGDLGARSVGSTKGGLVVVGSHVDLTTRQLEVLRQREEVLELEIEVARVIDAGTRDDYLREIVERAVSGLGRQNVVIRTSREVVTGSDAASSLEISRRVSDAVVAAVRGVIAACSPRFVIAKGGITSSDVASKALEIRHAFVVGPMLPGIVSLWKSPDGPAAGIPYIVFAGNVGDDESLAKIVGRFG